MISQLHLSALLGVAAVLWAALLIADGLYVSIGFFKPFSTVLGALVLLLSVFDKWAWRLRWLHPWFVSRPDLRGTWKGLLISTWVDPETGGQMPPAEAYLAIRQSFSSIHIRLIAMDSDSYMLAARIVRDADGVNTIVGTYRNTPRLLRRGVSPIHHGGMLLHVRGDPPSLLEGQYWTDRDTKGELRFTARSTELFHDFDAAAAGDYEART